MSLVERLIGLLPRRFAESLERESREWVFDCPTCHARHSIWDIGGIRWGASGNPRRRLRCPGCGDTRMMRIHRVRPDTAPPTEEHDHEA